MNLRRLFGAFLFLLAQALAAGTPGQGKASSDSAGRWVSAGPAMVDAVTGKMELNLPIGPTLPGRIPLGFVWHSEGYGTASFDAYQWPTWDDTQKKNIVTVTIGHRKTSFYRGMPNDANATPTVIQKWYTDRGLSTGQEKVGTLPQGYTAYFGATVFSSADGSSFLIASNWHIKTPLPPKPWGPNTVWPEDDTRVLASRMVVVKGDTLIWASFDNPAGDNFQEKAQPSTEIRNRWGDWVRFDKTLDSTVGTMIGATLTSSTGHSLTFGGAGSAWSISNSMGLPNIQMTSVGELWQGQRLTSVSVEGLGGNEWKFTWGLDNLSGFAIESRSGAKVEFQRVEGERVGTIPANECFDVDSKWKGYEPVTYTVTGNVEFAALDTPIIAVKFTSTTPGESGGSLIQFVRTIPKPSSYNPTSKTITWSSKDYKTEIRFHPQPDPGSSYRFTRMIHAKPVDVYGALGQPLNDQRQMALFAFSAVVQELQGTMQGSSEVIRKKVTHDGWTLKGPMNLNGDVVGQMVFNPEATRSTIELPLGYGPTQTFERLNWTGRIFGLQRQITSPSLLTEYDGTGRPANAVWRGGALPDSNQTTGGIVRTGTMTASWNADLARIQTQTSATSVGGSSYQAYRGATSVDLGSKSYQYDLMGRITLITGITGGYTSTLEQTPVSSGPEVASTTRRLSGPNGATIPLSGQVGEDFSYSGPWRTGARQRPDYRWSTEERDGLGRLSATVNLDGVRTVYFYDVFGRAWKTVRESKGTVPAVTAWKEWDTAGHWVREHTQGNDGSDVVTETRLDAFGRVVATITAKGTPAERTVYSEYDGFGQKIRQSLATKAGSTPRYSQTTYDVDGFVLQTKNTRGVVTATFNRKVAGTLDGQTGYLTTSSIRRRVGTSEIFVTQKSLQDGMGQVIRSMDALSQITKMAYDPYGRLREVRRGSQVRSYTYNEMGWLLNQTQPEEGTSLFQNHTLDGMPLMVTKGSGLNSTTIITSLYPSGGSNEGLIKTVTASGLGATITRTLTYDSQRRLNSRVDAQSNGTITETYGYDPLSRLRAKTITDGTASFSMSRDFDAFGNVVRQYYPSVIGQAGRTVVGSYDALNRLKGVTFGPIGSEAAVASMAYDQVINGEEGQQLTYANAATTTWQRNADQEQSRVIHKAGGSTIEDAGFAWANDGRMSSRGGDQFEYDKLGRLSKATVNGVNGERTLQSYGYDLYGNRISVGTSSLIGSIPHEAVSYGLTIGTDNRLPATTTTGVGTGVQYDAQGRMKQVWAIPGDTSTLTSWTYDALGRVISQGGGAAYSESYLLDGEGLQFKRLKANGTVRYRIYGFNREPLSTFQKTASSAPVWESDAIYAWGQLIFEKRGTQAVYQQGDHLGTPGVLTNAAGTVIGRQKSLPFGEAMLGSGGEKSLRRFTNHEGGAQLPIYMQARMYLPTYGRFAQVDPAYDHSDDGLNLYSYVSNEPITRTDPDGMRDVGAEGGHGANWSFPVLEAQPDGQELIIWDAVEFYQIGTGGWHYADSNYTFREEQSASGSTTNQNPDSQTGFDPAATWSTGGSASSNSSGASQATDNNAATLAVLVDSASGKRGSDGVASISNTWIKGQVDTLVGFAVQRWGLKLSVSVFIQDMPSATMGKTSSGNILPTINGVDGLLRNLEKQFSYVAVYLPNWKVFNAATGLDHNTKGITGSYRGNAKNVMLTYPSSPKGILAHEFMHTPGHTPGMNWVNRTFGGHNWTFSNVLWQYGIDPR